MKNRLIKYCSNKYNVALGAQSIQIGTLEYYRTLDPSFAIADDGEGTHTINFKEGVEIPVTPEVSERLFGGSIQGDSLTISGNRPGARFVSTVNNVYIFCVSIAAPEEPPSIAKAVQYDSSYDSYWEIIDPRAFRDVIGSALNDSLTLDCLSPYSRRSVETLPISQLSLQVRMIDGPVEYINSREHNIEQVDDVERIPKHRDALSCAIFRKELRDEHQQEYRFVFAVTHQKLGMLSVRREPIQVPLNRLNNIVAASVGLGT